MTKGKGEVSMSTVVVKDLRVAYNKGATVAVDNIGFDVQDGRFCVLLGPSGCGKTTVLHSIAGLIRPDRGEILIADKSVTNEARGIHVRPQDRNIAMVFQEYALYPNLNVRRNLAFPLETRGASREEIRRKVAETAELLGIKELLDRRPAHLSGGQRQRVALGRALVRDPDVFLLDEPLGNIDALLRVQVRFELQRIQRQLGVTMIYVTHDQVEAMAMADDIVLMKDGRIAQRGSPQALYETPRDRFVAGFLGMPPINFLRCTVAVVDGTAFLVGEDFRLPVPSALRSRLTEFQDGKEFVIGVRPSDFVRANGTDGGTVRYKVDVVEPSGDSVIIYGRIGSTLLTVKWSDGDVADGEELEISFSGARLHLFDPESGLALG